MCVTWADDTGGVKVKTKPQRRTLVVVHKSRTTLRSESSWSPKNAQMHDAMSEIPEGVYEHCQVKLEKATTVKSGDDNADSTDRGVPLVQYDLKLIRARSRFEGVSTPRNEWNKRLRTKTALEQASRTSTFKREEEKSRHHPRGANAKTGI